MMLLKGKQNKRKRVTLLCLLMVVLNGSSCTQENIMHIVSLIPRKISRQKHGDCLTTKNKVQGMPIAITVEETPGKEKEKGEESNAEAERKKAEEAIRILRERANSKKGKTFKLSWVVNLNYNLLKKYGFVF